MTVATQSRYQKCLNSILSQISTSYCFASTACVRTSIAKYMEATRNCKSKVCSDSQQYVRQCKASCAANLTRMFLTFSSENPLLLQETGNEQWDVPNGVRRSP